jgi:hypothetical protein
MPEAAPVTAATLFSKSFMAVPGDGVASPRASHSAGAGRRPCAAALCDDGA